MRINGCVLQRINAMAFSPKAYLSGPCLYTLIIIQPSPPLFVPRESVGEDVVSRTTPKDSTFFNQYRKEKCVLQARITAGHETSKRRV